MILAHARATHVIHITFLIPGTRRNGIRSANRRPSARINESASPAALADPSHPPRPLDWTQSFAARTTEAPLRVGIRPHANHRAKPCQCPNCRYDPRGLDVGLCPECGAEP